MRFPTPLQQDSWRGCRYISLTLASSRSSACRVDSSGRRNTDSHGGCDGHAEAEAEPFGAATIGVTRAAAGGGTGGAVPVLGGDSGRFVE